VTDIVTHLYAEFDNDCFENGKALVLLITTRTTTTTTTTTTTFVVLGDPFPGLKSCYSS